MRQSVDDLVDISIVGRCISESREGSVVSAALSCLAMIASIAPQRAFQYIFMACETIAASTLQQDDAFTQRTVSKSLKVRSEGRCLGGRLGGRGDQGADVVASLRRDSPVK